MKNSKLWGEKYISNPRFKGFDQIYYTAGDKKDVEKYGLLPLRYYYSLNYLEKSEIEKKDKKTKTAAPSRACFKCDATGLTEGCGSLRKTSEETLFKLYKNIDYNSIMNTFDYMFYKFKKGIFIIIRDNKLALFLPFSNVYYKNNWYHKTYFSEQEKKLLETEDYNKIKTILDKNIIDFQQKHPDQFKHMKINFNRKRWYANNCHFRNTFPEYEGGLNVNIYKSMLEALLKDRRVNDVEFFINPRDFPILKKDLTEPYNHLFDSEKVKVETQYLYDKMCPIFSKSATDKYADIMIPNEDDWARVSNKFFTDKCSDVYRENVLDKINLKWNKKENKCIFRGSATGCGITLDTNMRLRAADISLDNSNILDAGITDWNSRPKKYMGEPIKIIDTTKFRFGLSGMINNAEKSNYKYILNIDGHVSACRLSSELGMNSVVLLVNSPYKLWFSHLLEPYIHYVPVKKDLKDLVSQIKWCIAHDDDCKKIAENARKFYLEYLGKEGVFNYMEQKLNAIHKNKVTKNCLDIDKKILNGVKKNIAIIACFRDLLVGGERERERRIYVQLMNKLLVPYCNFHIYIIEQSDDGQLFNIGKLKNIGFEIASKNKENVFDHYIFTDIDIIPNYNLMKYFLVTPEEPLALAVRGTRYESHRIKERSDGRPEKIFLGALVSFSKKNFEDINGYANNFWGWGGEDDSLIQRIKHAGYKNICYPSEGNIIDIEEDEHMKTIDDVAVKVKGEKKDLEKIEKRYNDLTSWKKNGLNSLEYKVLGKDRINRDTTQIRVDLMKNEDMKKHPEWFPKPTNNYKTLQKELARMDTEMVVKYI